MNSARALFSRLVYRGVCVGVIGNLALPTLAQRESGFGDGEGYNAPAFRPVPVFFPPNPPALGRLVSKLTIPNTLPGQQPAPPELAADVAELYYAPLSTLLVERKLSEKLRLRLAAYRADRAALLSELRTVLEHTRGEEPAVRKVAWTALAREQSTRLSTLEATAEQLRSDFFVGDYDWSALREWRLGGHNTRGDSPVEIASVLRAYAYYQAGFQPVQRRLLREISNEVVSGSEDAAAAAAAQQFIYFSPELARVKLPDTLPADIAAKVAAYETKKSTLKKELFDSVIAHDGATFAFTRTAAFKTLCEKQAASAAALDPLADEIREGLANVPELAAQTPRSPLPPQLTQRSIAAVEARTALVRESRARIDAILARVPPSHPVAFSYTLDNEGIKVRPVARRGRGGGGPTNDPLTTAVVAELTQVGTDYKVRSDELSRDVESLRTDIGRHLGAKSTPSAIDQAIDGVVRYHVALENEGAYAEYRIAVFEPGLSPPQRRLLFAGAVVRLELALPRAEMQATRRPAGW